MSIENVSVRTASHTVPRTLTVSIENVSVHTAHHTVPRTLTVSDHVDLLTTYALHVTLLQLHFRRMNTLLCLR